MEMAGQKLRSLKIDIIIPVWNQADATKACITHLIKNTQCQYRLIAIDNGSDDPVRELLNDIKTNYNLDMVIIRNEKNMGFVKAVNQGLKLSDASYVCILNNDTKPSPGWLTEMVEFAEGHRDIGLINPVCDGDQRLSLEYHAENAKKNKGKYLELNQCFLFATLMRREVIDKIGYLDERFGVGCLEDTDYALRAAIAGYRCAMLYSSYVEHAHGISFKALGNREAIVARNELEFFKKWPRHLRVGLGLSLSQRDNDIKVENLLKAALFLAREWCWINVLIFGNKKLIAKKLAVISEKISIPKHQNIKYNYLPESMKKLHLLARLLERSFGTKKRKRYDIFFVDDKRTSKFLNIFSFIHSTSVNDISFENDLLPFLRDVVYSSRGMCVQGWSQCNQNPG